MIHLHPFFSYFGSKYRLAKYYPAPDYDELVEPFAGSAGYALWHPQKRVVLCDLYEPVVELWDYLIHVTEAEVLALPLGPFTKDYPIDAENIPRPAMTLLGFWNTESQTSASRYPLSKSRGGNWTAKKRHTIASQLRYIRHWTVENCSFEQVLNRPATWFIDPPYEEAGKRYRNNTIDYTALGQWCRERQGQVIVCEQNHASWLAFEHLKTDRKIRNASNNDYKELVWCQHD